MGLSFYLSRGPGLAVKPKTGVAHLIPDRNYLSCVA